VVVVLGLLAGLAIPRIIDSLENTRISATREEMRQIRIAITGDPRTVAGNSYTNRGFEGDVGFPPTSLFDLVRRPDSIPAYDPFLKLGWNGPYLDSAGQEYLHDAWDSLYVYSPAERTLKSVGAEPDVTLAF